MSSQILLVKCRILGGSGVRNVFLCSKRRDVYTRPFGLLKEAKALRKLVAVDFLAIAVFSNLKISKLSQLSSPLCPQRGENSALSFKNSHTN